jgi:hypothetical protein
VLTDVAKQLMALQENMKEVNVFFRYGNLIKAEF